MILATRTRRKFLEVWRRIRVCRLITIINNDIDGTTDSKSNDTSNLPIVMNSSEETVRSSTYIGYLAGVVSSLFKSDQLSGGSSENKPRDCIIAKRLSRTEVVKKTRQLVSNFVSDSSFVKHRKIPELCHHFSEYPSSRLLALEDKRFIRSILYCLRNAEGNETRNDIRQCLSVLGYVKSPQGKGVRILSIDGGGTRGMMGLEVLQALEDSLNGLKVSEVFDHIVGVSTGAIIAALLTIKRLSIKECKRIYYDLSLELFDQGKISGVSGLILSHSYYNTKKWITMLREIIGEITMLDTCRSESAPKLSIISCIVNAPSLKPYIFRNYEYPPGRESHFRGGCNHCVWQALQASAAAPGYFEEVAIGSVLHQDGGVLANNPTALALHEAHMLWQNFNIQCVISIGNGRSVTDLEPASARMSTGIQEKITRIVDSATDTELVHLCMNDLLPTNTYFRFNPYMSFPYSLDESDRKKLVQMERDAQLYIRRNRVKLTAAAEVLLSKPTVNQKAFRKISELAFNYGLYA